MRFVILFLLVMVVFGNQYAFNNPQALQESIIKELDISEASYDMLYTIFSLPNIVMTPLIGYLIDYIGYRKSIFVLAVGVMVAQLFISISAANHSYNGILVSRMFFGIASESLVTAQACFVSVWFVGKELDFALGLAITLPELGNALNSYLTPLIYERWGLSTPLFVSVIICGFAVVCAVLALYLDHRFKPI